MPEARAKVDELIELRADLAELGYDLKTSGISPRGGLADAKGLEARMSEIVSWFADQGIELKGIAPVLIDFPAVRHGVSVRLCWIEGEAELAWYHRSELGFAGRRRL